MSDDSLGAQQFDRIIGETYAAIVVDLDDRDRVITALAKVRFSGWVAPAHNGWLPLVAASGDGSVATGRRGVVDVAAWLAQELAATVGAVRVIQDKQLLLAMWTGTEEIGRYVSDPSVGRGDDVLPEAMGVEFAEGFAAAAGRAEAGAELAEVLAEELDPDSMIESERLGLVLHLLGWPAWLVAASSLPKDVPGGPSRREVTQLRDGVTGISGRLRGFGKEATRRRRPPADPVPDAPLQTPIEPWML